MGKLEGKIALVTGASRGIGREIALAFAREGADVAANYNKSQSAAESLVAAIAAEGGEASLSRLTSASRMISSGWSPRR